MIKIVEPNYQMLLNSAISALQDTYSQYKKAMNESLRWSFVNNDGEFCILGGYEERQAKIDELSREILRLQFKIKELKECIDGCEKERNN